MLEYINNNNNIYQFFFTDMNIKKMIQFLVILVPKVIMVFLKMVWIC